jgi:hypothetical protein
MEQAKLADAGFWEDESTTPEGHARLRAKVGGMHCSLCTGIIERTLRNSNAPLETSITESIPNPVSATEPAARPATIAMTPSRAL